MNMFKSTKLAALVGLGMLLSVTSGAVGSSLPRRRLAAEYTNQEVEGLLRQMVGQSSVTRRRLAGGRRRLAQITTTSTHADVLEWAEKAWKNGVLQGTFKQNLQKRLAILRKLRWTGADLAKQDSVSLKANGFKDKEFILRTIRSALPTPKEIRELMNAVPVVGGRVQQLLHRAPAARPEGPERQPGYGRSVGAAVKVTPGADVTPGAVTGENRKKTPGQTPGKSGENTLAKAASNLWDNATVFKADQTKMQQDTKIDHTRTQGLVSIQAWDEKRTWRTKLPADSRYFPNVMKTHKNSAQGAVYEHEGAWYLVADESHRYVPSHKCWQDLSVVPYRWYDVTNSGVRRYRK